MSRLAGRVALVTGASRGLGAAVAERLAAEGAHVVLTARTVGGLEEVDDAIRGGGGGATLAPLDLTDHEGIDRLGAAIYERFGRLDILVGNAAMLGTISPTGHIDPKIWERVLSVNLTANWRLIRIFDPLLRRSEAGRAIFVTCAPARGAAPYWGAYAASKAALETLIRNYAGEVTKTALRVNLIDPGPLRTKLRAAAFPLEDPAALRLPEDAAPAFIDLAAAGCARHGELVEVFKETASAG